MSDSKPSQAKRTLPSWMSSRPDKSKTLGQNAGSEANEDCGPASRTVSGAAKFSKLLEGVVFVLSGFVNPERSTLRSQALEMGAEYQPDWNSNCTLLVCAFPNTPKFRQVEADNGTIVSKEWISECYSQKKLVDIEVYLMHAGKPWRRSNQSDKALQDQETSLSKNSHKKVEKGSGSKKSTPSVSSKNASRDLTEQLPSPSKVKSWVSNDLNRTISWLECQEEKPEEFEIRKIAAEGILTCLQDAIDALEQNQVVQRVCEQWNILPQAVEELIKLEGSRSRPSLISNEDIRKWASNCKQIYEDEYKSLEESSQKKRGSSRKEAVISKGSAGYDSDETIEMTEEEIDLALNRVASEVPKISR
ncbi:DNA-repair protein XRCC1 [Punica granatum]|uniref:DNA-repair protein XRCC1 n=2 Tax=Punica granatum TaxID=22663 RepID=A0A6P8DD50_PUNGR|nr:DNA-repair protein XRCC1 [Punica granatum]PKI47811.1 hypothetical protein CRG98_031772 [Punica granatum]